MKKTFTTPEISINRFSMPVAMMDTSAVMQAQAALEQTGKVYTSVVVLQKDE